MPDLAHQLNFFLIWCMFGFFNLAEGVPPSAKARPMARMVGLTLAVPWPAVLPGALPHLKGERRDPAAVPTVGLGQPGSEKKVVTCWGWPVLASLTSRGILDNYRFILPLLEAVC